MSRGDFSEKGGVWSLETLKTPNVLGLKGVLKSNLFRHHWLKKVKQVSSLFDFSGPFHDNYIITLQTEDSVCSVPNIFILLFFHGAPMGWGSGANSGRCEGRLYLEGWTAK